MFKWISKLMRKWLPLEEDQLNDIVIDFLSEWLDWAISRPSLDTACFEKRYGLCQCLRLWGGHKGYDFKEIRAMQDRLSDMFVEDRLHASYPFGHGNYIRCAENNTMHLSKKRRDWVISRIERAIHDY